MNPVFEVEFKCGNCWKTFKKQFEKGIEIKEHSWTISVEIYEKGMSSIKNNINCPNCDSSKVTIKKRKPVVPRRG